MEFRKTVDGVLGSLSRAITDLGTVADRNEAMSTKLGSRIEGLRIEQGAAESEANRARRVQERLQELLA